ncbi:MAG: heparinase II/III family protein [Alphaproteobacteria bacterium]
MPFQLIENIKKTAGHITYSTPLYSWCLNDKAPDRLIVKPVDPWPGNADKARELLNAAGIGERTGALWYKEWWEPEEADDIWHTHMHSFGWLRDLRTLGGALAKEQGRVMLSSWIERYDHWDKNSWRSDLIGRRLAMWISHYDYFCAGQGDHFEEKVLASLSKQAKHLSNILGATHTPALLETIKGLLYVGIALEDHDKWINQAINALEKTLSVQILADGGHISRSPDVMLNVLQILVDIRSAFKAGAYTTPGFIKDTIEQLSAALRSLRHSDRKLALFHGTQEGSIDHIDSVLAQAGTRKKTLSSLEKTGFERLDLGRSLLIMDTGRAPDYPYDKDAHASPLAFEFGYGKERLLVSCGSHPISPDWKEALRFTAAHNTACLDHRNACEIKKDKHFGRKTVKCNARREETHNSILLSASHDGYVPLNGITHTRTLCLTDQGHSLHGEDGFTSASDHLTNPVEVAVRFHIHPNVMASVTQDGQDILLRMPGGVGWRFSTKHHGIKLEDSLYVGQGIDIKKTKQIVIGSHMKDLNISVKWSLKRED